MHKRLSQFLTQATAAIINSNSSSVAWLTGHWRGANCLLEFIQKYPESGSPLAESESPASVVVIEFARWLMGWSGTDQNYQQVNRHFDEQTNQLISYCEPAIQVCIEEENAARKKHLVEQTVAWQTKADRYRICLALTSVAKAAVEWNRRKGAKLAAHQQAASDLLARAAKHYDAARFFRIERTGQQPATPENQAPVNEDPSIATKSGRLLDLAWRYGAFGKAGVTIPTWLTIERLLTHIFNEPSPDTVHSNVANMLVVDHQENAARVVPAQIALRQNAGLGGNLQGVFLDPLTWGITTIDTHMRMSLWYAWRCCIPIRHEIPNQSLQISVEMPALYPHVGGPSAGALLAAVSVCTARKLRVDSNRTATCELAIEESNVSSDDHPFRVEDMEFKPIGGRDLKIEEAWQLQHGIEEIFLAAADATSWKASHPNWNTPAITPVASLAELIAGLTRNQVYERELQRYSRGQFEIWDRVKQAIEHDEPDVRERDHRFDCYVDPKFHIEGSQATNAELLEKAADLAPTRRGGHGVREEFPVPGGTTNDDQLLNVLELFLAKTAPEWPKQPEWLKPGRNLVIYDDAGAGKTVCSFRIAHLLNSPDEIRRRLFRTNSPPLVIRLDGRWPREQIISGELLSVREALVDHFARASNLTSPEHRDHVEKCIEYALNQSTVAMVIDGLDQFSNDDLNHLVNLYQHDPDARLCRWIVTSRVHTIDQQRTTMFRDEAWTRVRIEPFDEKQQDEYFNLPANRPIGPVWTETVPDRENMGDLLGLPMVLAQIRLLIDDANSSDKPLPVFRTLSELYLLTSRRLLERALLRNSAEVNSRLANKGIELPRHLADDQQLELLEQILTLLALQMMLMEEYNGQTRGERQTNRFLNLCKDRFFVEIDQKLDNESNRRKQLELEDQLRKKQLEWNWAVEVLQTIELNHRTVTEAFTPAGIAFRNRKMVECHAARYLTRHARHWDIFAADDETVADDLLVVDPNDDAQNLSNLCAWNYTTHPQWRETWILAIEMPQQPTIATDLSGVVQNAVIDHQATLCSLSALFRLPKPYPDDDRDIRPTELMFRAWHLLEYEPDCLLGQWFQTDEGSMTGRQILDRWGDSTLSEFGQQLLLGQAANSTRVIKDRQVLLEVFRQSSRAMVAEFECRFDQVLQHDGSRLAIPPEEKARKESLKRWQQQSAFEKSHTFLPCPPQSWIDAYEALAPQEKLNYVDPRINTAVKGLNGKPVIPVRIQATSVTRGQYRQFDPRFEENGSVHQRIKDRASAFDQHSENEAFPIICTNWFDAWMFCKWLGPQFHLPDEWNWEHACRAGTDTLYHFGNQLDGTLANCDGNHPYGVDDQGNRIELAKGPYLERTTPVGLRDYPVNEFGLFDMHGNVWEWCANAWDRAESDEPGSSRVLRGGSWFSSAGNCRCSDRDGNDPHDRGGSVGFRVCGE